MLEKLKSKLNDYRVNIEKGIGKKTVPPEIEESRYSICVSCDKLNTSLKTCKLCYCYMPLKTKLAEASCPKKLWLKYEE